jgi:hypothetical protein
MVAVTAIIPGVVFDIPQRLAFTAHLPAGSPPPNDEALRSIVLRNCDVVSDAINPKIQPHTHLWKHLNCGGGLDGAIPTRKDHWRHHGKPLFRFVGVLEELLELCDVGPVELAAKILRIQAK